MNELPLDHLALRVHDRDAAADFLKMFGYSKQAEFKLTLEDGSTAQSYALTHPASVVDVFVSSGPLGSKIDNWVKARGGKGAVHHLAYRTADVVLAMKGLQAKGVTFKSPQPLVCSCERPLTQIFTEENPQTGIIYELIDRNGHPGFCEENVRRLMNSSPQ